MEMRKGTKQGLRAAALAILAMLVIATTAAAQTITTGTLSGTVEDQQGGRLPGATVEAVHVATGTTYNTVTSAPDGRYSILNVRVGTYNIKVTLSGFKPAERKDVTVGLGEDKAVAVKLELAQVAETVTVVAETSAIDLSRAGTAGSISNEVKEALPTITRGITDIARTNVYFNPMGLNEDTPVSSVAGRSQRYNSFQIDGAVNNDLFGLAAGGGSPGGNAGTQPIAFDAIQEIQLVVSPYDIRQSGFSGGGINAITKSGTNALHGSAFLYGRNQKWVGKGITNTAISTFRDKQGGGSLGGKVVQNKVFFFGTLDYGRKATPAGVSVGGTGVQFLPGNEALVDRFIADLKNLYGYDLGPSAKNEYTRETNSDKFFGRADFNIGRSQLTVRHNYVNARNDVGTPTTGLYIFPDGFYRFGSKTNSTVGQLTSRFGAAVNEARVAYTRVREQRGTQPCCPNPFPNVTVNLLGTVQARAGIETFSGANQLDQDIVEITDDYTKVMGRHQITLGTHNEFFKFRNLFIRDFYGNYTFTSLANFESGAAQNFSHSFSATSDPLQPAKFGVNHMGFYAGDQWHFSQKLTLTGGARLDVVRFPDTPNANPVAEQNFGYRTDIVPNNVLFSPRVGFNWARRGDLSEQIRGGIGLFAGRTPYVWMSNQYGNTGVDFTRLSVTNGSQKFVSDPLNQPTSVSGTGAATNEIDLIDPNFKYPSVIRGNLAYDRKLPLGLYGTFEWTYTSTVNDIRYQNINLQQVGTLSVVNPSGANPDGRPTYLRNKVPTLGDVLLLTNTTAGNSWTMAFEVKRPFKSGFFVDVAYLYGDSHTTMDGTRDQAISTWNTVYTPGDPNNVPLARSDYSPGNRINITTTYNMSLGKGYSATASLFYSGQSGRPYSLLFGGSGVNGDTASLNDLFYLPTASDQITYTNGTYQDLQLFMQVYDCTNSQIGQIMKRNTCRGPWINTADARFAVTLPFKKVKAEITWDILNLINLFDPKGGLFRYANFNDVLPVVPTVTSGVLTGYNLATITAPGFDRFTRSDLRSRWQMQLGGRVRF
jgi:Carboxypeptidase regulatory-like domain